MSLREKAEAAQAARAEALRAEQEQQVQTETEKKEAKVGSLLASAEMLKKIADTKKEWENSALTIQAGKQALRKEREELRSIHKDSKDELTGEAAVPTPEEILSGPDKDEYQEEPEVVAYNQARTTLQESFNSRDQKFVETLKDIGIIEEGEEISVREGVKRLQEKETSIQEDLKKFQIENPGFLEEKIEVLAGRETRIKAEQENTGQRAEKLPGFIESEERSLGMEREHLDRLKDFIAKSINFNLEITQLEEKMSKAGEHFNPHRDAYGDFEKVKGPQAVWQAAYDKTEGLKSTLGETEGARRNIGFDPLGTKKRKLDAQIQTLNQEIKVAEKDRDKTRGEYETAFNNRVERDTAFKDLLSKSFIGSTIDNLLRENHGSRRDFRGKIKEAVTKDITRVETRIQESQERIRDYKSEQVAYKRQQKELEVLEEQLGYLRSIPLENKE